jgi:hypothetical protein
MRSREKGLVWLAEELVVVLVVVVEELTVARWAPEAMV